MRGTPLYASADVCDVCTFLFVVQMKVDRFAERPLCVAINYAAYLEKSSVRNGLIPRGQYEAGKIYGIHKITDLLPLSSTAAGGGAYHRTGEFMVLIEEATAAENVIGQPQLFDAAKSL